MRTKLQWGRLFRRGAALFMATIAVWVLLLCVRGGAAVDGFRDLEEDRDFVTAVLAAELHMNLPSAEGLDRWGMLVVSQSPLLQSGRDVVAQLLTGGEAQGTEATPDLPAGQPARDHDDVTAPPEAAVTTAPEDIVERTLVPADTGGYVYADGLYLYNRTGLEVDLAAAVAAKADISLPEEGPQVLIVHTHGSEAYTPDGTDVYQSSDSNSRTLDESYNVVRIGDEVERVFTELGLTVIHDHTLYDYPQYSGAYGRSGAGIEAWLEQYPSIKIVLDIHRDALIGEDGTVYKPVTTIDGSKTAQVMLVLGSSEGGEHPDWEENLALAAKIQKSMDTLYPTLARPMTLRTPVYNQQLTNGSLLVEVGSHGNTLQEALAGARLFARAAGQVLLGLK